MNEQRTTQQNAELKRSVSSGYATGAAKTENEIATLILDCAVELHRKFWVQDYWKVHTKHL